MKILRSNLMSALTIAIQTELDANPNYESTFVAGLKEVLAALERGERVEIC